MKLIRFGRGKDANAIVRKNSSVLDKLAMKGTLQTGFRTNYIFKSVLFCIIFTGLLVVFSFLKSFLPEKTERLAYGTIGTGAAFLTTYLFLRFERKKFADIGLRFERTTINKFFIGVLIGIVLMGLMSVGVIFFSGFKVEVNKNGNFLNFLLLTLPLVPLAFMEEIGFRAYPLITLKEKAGIRTSIIVTSLLFALYHVVNGWTVANSFLGAGVWGVVFGLSAIHSNGIAMPTGLHYAANLTTSAFGISVNPSAIWILTQNDGSSLEGYQASPEATLIPSVSLLIFGIICMGLFLRNKNYR